MARGVSIIVAVLSDDDRLSAHLRALLATQRYYTVPVTSASVRSDLWEYPWDILVADRTSAEVIRSVRTEPEFSARVIVSMTTDGEDSVEALDAGADESMSCDPDDDEFLARVNAARRLVDIKSALMIVHNRLSLLSITDGLTGVYNHRYFQEQLTVMFEKSRTSGAPFSLVFLDIDHFKGVNDGHGHSVGDRVLLELSNQLTGFVRASDVLARYGGEEFALILGNTTANEARDVAERIRAHIAARPIVDDVRITLSLGVASHPLLGAATPAELLRRADEAAYRAKRTGRNRVVVARRSRAAQPSDASVTSEARA